ncbi:MAG: hypothetical protein ACI8S6_003733 [Myxococcota bacterium]|jgi:hypothetical protein
MGPLALLLLGCRPGVIDLSVEVSEAVSTVVTVHWQTDDQTRGYVEHGLTDRYGQRTPLTAEGTVHSALLLGLHADEQYHLRVVLDSGEFSNDAVVTTGSLPSALPELILEGDPGSWSGYVPVPIIGNTTAAVIIDQDGEIVWYALSDPMEGAEDQGGRRVLLSRDGEGVYANQIGTEGKSQIHWWSWDGSEQRTLDVLDHNHDFVERADGSLTAMRYELRDGLTADRITRVDLDGSLTDLWSVHDHLTPDRIPDSGSWTHANALDLDEDSDALYLGMLKINSIVRLKSGGTEIDWILGDERYGFSDFTYTEGSTPFERQHQLQLVEDDQLLVFDNHPSDRTRVVEYQLDLEQRRIEEVWSHTPDPPLEVYALGDVDRRRDGSTFINWSTAGILELIDEEGESMWRLSTSLGYAFGYGTAVDTLQAE